MKLKNRLTSGEIAERIANLQVEHDAMEAQVNELNAKAIEQSVDEEAHRIICDEISAMGPKVVHKRQLLADLEVLRARVIEEERIERLNQIRKREREARAASISVPKQVDPLLAREESRHRKAVIDLKTRILSAKSEAWNALIDLAVAECEDYRITGSASAQVKNAASSVGVGVYYEQYLKDLRMRKTDVDRKLHRLHATDISLREMESI